MPLRRETVIVCEVALLEPIAVAFVLGLSERHRVLLVDEQTLDRPRFLRAGASGFVARPVDAAALCRAILRAHEGELVIGSDDEGSAPPQPSRRTGHLTPRETDVLRLIASGSSTHATARELHLSAGTVKTHLRNASEKLGTPNRAAAAARATSLGLLG